MRTARLVGLSSDGRFLIVVTDSGEELAVAADDRLRAALRGDRPRLGQLEIEMDSALTPRDIQSRIRAGQSLDDVARVAGIPADRVERFAAPVLAEREHIARVAMASTVRRRGETSAHRTLQATLVDRLGARSVDLDTLSWDAHRLNDGRWVVVADYRSGEAARRAEFLFDLAARFSVAGNDDARWMLGEQSPTKGPQPGRRRPDGQHGDAADTEPTLDLSDELALVRVVQDGGSPLAAQPTEAPEATADPPENASRQDRGLSDAAAVPVTVSGGWEPAIVVSYPVEPGPADDADGPPAEPHEPPPVQVLSPDATPAVVPIPQGGGTDLPGPPEPIVSGEDRRDEAEALAEEHGTVDEPSAPAKAPKRKRAAVPSWDEIMFGGPKRP